MKLSAILLARTIAFFELVEANPRGALFLPDVIRDLVQRYSFQKFPRSIEEWESEKGAEFVAGRLGNDVINKLVFWNTGITVETRAGTEKSKELIIELLRWAKDNFGLSQGEEIVREWAYISDVSFYSDVPILSSVPIDNLRKRVTSEITNFLPQPIEYSPIGFSVGHDPLLRKHGRAPFTIQRRADTPFELNLYFSEAPLPTEVHLKLLEEFEKDVAGNR